MCHTRPISCFYTREGRGCSCAHYSPIVTCQIQRPYSQSFRVQLSLGAGRSPLARNTFAPVSECLPTASAFFSNYFLPPLVSKPLPHIHLQRHPFLFSPPSPLHWMQARGVSPLSTLLPIVSDHSSNPDAVLIRPFERMLQRGHHVASYSGGESSSIPPYSLSTMLFK